MQSEKVRLTQLAKKGGCAAKIAAKELRGILEKIQFPPVIKQVLVDGRMFDDAAIVKIAEDLALVQTLDFFTPIVDSPRTFGQIAAANALSDVYAMGGLPQTALAILAFPTASLDSVVVQEVLQGACDILKEAECSLVGGHSIDDETLKFGLSVNGTVNPNKVWSNAGAKEGQDLILTKPLGTGTASAALKENAVTEEDIADVLKSMTTLNNVPGLLTETLRDQVTCATDITGFGLLGHGLQMARASQVCLELAFESIPLFSKTLSLLKEEFTTRAHFTNQRYVEADVDLNGLDVIKAMALFDPQTSGGLLLSVNSKFSQDILKAVRTKFPASAIIGRVTRYDGKYRIKCRDL